MRSICARPPFLPSNFCFLVFLPSPTPSPAKAIRCLHPLSFVPGISSGDFTSPSRPFPPPFGNETGCKRRVDCRAGLLALLDR